MSGLAAPDTTEHMSSACAAACTSAPQNAAEPRLFSNILLTVASRGMCIIAGDRPLTLPWPRRVMSAPALPASSPPRAPRDADWSNRTRCHAVMPPRHDDLATVSPARKAASMPAASDAASEGARE